MFKTKNGKNTDVLHSGKFFGSDFKSREYLAFAKENSVAKSRMSEKDKLLLRGYATAVAERQKAYAYKHKNDKK